MLARSASTPILNTWIPSHSVELSPEPDFHHQIPKPQSISLTSPFNSISHSENSSKTMTRARSENDLRDVAVTKRSPFHHNLKGFVEEEEEQEEMLEPSYSSMDRLFSSSGLDELVEEDCIGGGIGRNGGRFSSGDGFSESDDPNDSTDAYYQKMIESDPGNSLVLGNYAKFLKEVRCDLVKAEEYFERAVLANPNDGNVASLYAELIWEVHKDASRAEKYHDRAVQAEPDNCYVMASYARFLWDADEEEEEEKVDEENGESESCKNITSPPDLFRGVSFPYISAY